MGEGIERMGARTCRRDSGAGKGEGGKGHLIPSASTVSHTNGKASLGPSIPPETGHLQKG